MAPHVLIVIPMLNEEETLLSTCSSLGAFRRATEREVVLVDNGSTDRTWSVAQEIRANSIHRIHVVREEERGHVPPRRTGCRVARQLAEDRGWPLEQVIICQGDADTIYDDDYVDEMIAAMAARKGAIYEGRSILRADENHAAPIQSYLNSCAQTDRLVEHCFASEDDDIIVDDKVAAYYLSDYFRWGEHQREYSSRGDELLAETTRLYMRAIAGGATRVRVNSAFARHSVRRILAEMWMHFASAGFPREASWRERHRSRADVGDLTTDTEGVDSRLRHVLGLFALLPAHVAVALGAPRDQRFRSLLPPRSLAELRSSPGVLLEDVLRVIDDCGDELIRICASAN
jgi:glycosyltransferase involved in cell wall biosynthesis